jgi:hypothetical protein
MRAVFGILGLLAVVLVVGVLAKKQLGAGVAPGAGGTESSAPAATPKQQVRQFEQAVQGVMQQARPMPENDK